MTPPKVPYRKGVSPFSPGSRRRHGFLIGLVALLWIPVSSCTDSGGRSESASSSLEESTTAAQLDRRTLDVLAAGMCDVYAHWPPVPVGNSHENSLNDSLAHLSTLQRDSLTGDSLAVHASHHCPDVIAEGSLAAGSGLPRPAGRLEDVPGLFDAATAGNDEELRSRYEWTAIGLGCASFLPDPADALGDGENEFLSAMGYTLPTYVEESLNWRDPSMSRRIFTAIHACAGRSQLPPTPRVAP